MISTIAEVSSTEKGTSTDRSKAMGSIHRQGWVLSLAGVVCFHLAGWSSVVWSGTIQKTPSDPNIISELSSRLLDAKSSIRREAAVRLAQFGSHAKPALDNLYRNLEDSDPFVRAHAARAIYRINGDPKSTVPALTELLQPEQSQLCCLAALILGEIGPAAESSLSTLRQCMKESDPSVRLHAAEASLRIDPYDVTAQRELLAALEDEKSDTRYFAVNALGSAGGRQPQTQFALQWLLTDSDSQIAIAASLHLSKQFDLADAAASSEPTVSQEEIAMYAAQLRDEATSRRVTAAIKLGQCGRWAKAAASALRECVDDDDLVVRVHAAHALWRIERQPGEVVSELIDLVGKADPPVGIAAIHILGEIGAGAAEALPSLHDVFIGRRQRARMHVAWMISRIDSRDREMLGMLLAALHDSSSDVRFFAATALGSSSIGHQRRVEHKLTVAAEDRNLRVEAAAADAVDRLQARTTIGRNALTADFAANFERKPGSEIPQTQNTEPVATRHEEPEEAAAAGNSSGASAADSANVDGSSGSVTALPVSTRRRSSQYEATRRQFAEAQEENQRDTLRDRRASQKTESSSSNSDELFDATEGLKKIGNVRASGKIAAAGPLPVDYAQIEIAKIGPPQFQGLGYNRGFGLTGFGWDAPAVCYRPLYFEDVNVERYGTHWGFWEIARTTGLFTKNCILFPYKIIVQPGCENIYDLGYERPGNCIPLHCYHDPCPELSIRNWIDRQHFRPYRAACPWDKPDDCGNEDCDENDGN